MKRDLMPLSVRYRNTYIVIENRLISIDKWANQIASDNNDTYHIQIPSDIKPGTYVLRTELIALHGNFKELKTNLLRDQIQVYNHCFNIEVIGNGTATPEGVTFPGAYKPNDFGFTFRPFFTYGNDTTGATEQNSKYVSYFNTISSIMYLIVCFTSLGSTRSAPL
jgi:hypothetical protein